MSSFIKIIKLVNSNGIDITNSIEQEIELQKVASSYGFTPKILSTCIKGDKYHIEMEKIDAMCLADKYGDKPDDIPKYYWYQIKSIISLLFNREGIEYIDITPYNFIEKNDKIYLIDFGHAFYTSKLNRSNSIPSDWFLRDFLDHSKQIYEYNQDFE